MAAAYIKANILGGVLWIPMLSEPPLASPPPPRGRLLYRNLVVLYNPSSAVSLPRVKPCKQPPIQTCTLLAMSPTSPRLHRVVTEALVEPKACSKLRLT